MVLRSINTAGGTLAVEIEGEGPLVICSPGMGDTRDAYAPFAKQLVSQGYCVASMDIRGHGDSSTTFTQYGDAAQAEDFLTVAKELNKGPAVLAGCSFSAGAATIAAGKSPESVVGIILLGPFLRNPMGAVGMWFMPLLFRWPWGPTMWQMYVPTLWPGLGEQAKERAASSTKSLTRSGRWSAFYQTVCGCNHDAVTPWLGKAKCPALVVMGDKDPDFSKPKEEAEWVASNFSDAKVLMLEGVGHAPMLERPEAVSKAALDFLGKLRDQVAWKSATT
ncbi:hypothetical protein BAUCODRAFT_38060 [Baudoinia panamericana UAMH 10762]|uniref:AB hydrolase-1 domain-containing protein n=1 Tax=Baudoinia panamericana (strain UAMH 10762) TaxID=717646 RepID=M2LDJ5_BAUPA|nr:uncharacterized protein BAUCODRAFT_38060 [Baudoinia panamericana UAMH 10762]EMC92042.1 hypothetical protein BAUCODRAFT_38060 [Baudoinia panamericana UAMH 10762]